MATSGSIYADRRLCFVSHVIGKWILHGDIEAFYLRSTAYETASQDFMDRTTTPRSCNSGMIISKLFVGEHSTFVACIWNMAASGATAAAGPNLRVGRILVISSLTCLDSRAEVCRSRKLHIPGSTEMELKPVELGNCKSVALHVCSVVVLK